LPDDAAYEEAFRACLTRAVTVRLPAGAAGIYLSGGLDSSSVACLAGPPTVAFSAVFDEEPRSDERIYAAAAAEKAGSEHVHCYPERTSPLADWPGAPGRWPAPSCDPQSAVVRAITEEAVARGVTVLLNGFGGDSVVSHGAAYLSELLCSIRPRRFLAEVEAIAHRHRRSAWRLARDYGLMPQVPRAVLRHRRTRQIAGSGIPVRPDVASALGVHERLGERAAQTVVRTARDAQLRELTSGHIALALEGSYHVDRAVGVERRYPFLDRRLAELCLSLPGDQKLREGWTRSILRRSLARVLPETVRTRVGKTDLTYAFRRGLLTADRALLEGLVANPTAVADIVDPAALRALWHRCLADSGASDCYALWRVAALADWLRRHSFADEPLRT
jgi:asparagine synthase (glutamine-hydrolysing)